MLLLVVLLALFVQAGRGQRTSSIDLHKALGPLHVCAVGSQTIQFMSDSTLVALTSSNDNCYKDVDALQLVSISTLGRVIRKKIWPSTYPVIVLALNRLAASTPDKILIFNERFEVLQSLAVPNPGLSTGLGQFLYRSPTGGVELKSNQSVYRFEGLPLKLVDISAMSAGLTTDQVIHAEGGKRLLRGKNWLIEDDGPTKRNLVNLDWITSCNHFCQEYEAGVSFALPLNDPSRILIQSNGSRFPITDAAGLFPFFRVAIFDLRSGAELFRRQYVTRTGLRYAAISPDGKTLALFNGSNEITFETLNP